MKDYGFGLQELKAMGINVINLNISHRKLFNKAVMLEMICTTNKYIEKGLETGSVYVHCRSGKNRSPVVVSAFLVYDLGLTPELSFKLVKKRRRAVEYTYLKEFLDIYKDE